jgi:macrolide-specific efflux system membrane fusion protein
MKRVIIILSILIVTIGLSVAGYFYTAPVQPKSLAEEPGVNIITVGRETLVDTVEATGRIEPRAEVEMKFEIGGMVKEVLVKRGQKVTAGAVLARLVTTDLELEIERAGTWLSRRPS